LGIATIVAPYVTEFPGNLSKHLVAATYATDYEGLLPPDQCEGRLRPLHSGRPLVGMCVLPW
jgi:hypothetical protein